MIRAIDFCRALGDHQASLEFGQQLIAYHPKSWLGYGLSTQDLAELRRLKEAQATIDHGLEQLPDQLNLLVIATNLYRSLPDRQRSLYLAQRLIACHPENWIGYGQAARNLWALKKYPAALSCLRAGLQNHPTQQKLLLTAIELFHNAGQHESSLAYAQQLIASHPELWHGYAKAAHELLVLKRFAEALIQIQQGLLKFPANVELKRMQNYISAFLSSSVQVMADDEAANCQFSMMDLIAYSKDPRYFRVIQERKTKTGFTTSQGFPKKLLFVAGMGRSGTTALGRMLNLSSDLEMYTELYSAYQIIGYHAQQFELENLTAKARLSKHGVNRRMLERHSRSRVIGDKRPHFQFCAESTYDNFPKGQVKIIFIDRSLRDICRSSHVRSENISDRSWGLEIGIEHTILLYNASCRQINYLYKYRKDVFDAFTFVRYEDVFVNLDLARSLFVSHDLRLDEQAEESLANYIETSSGFVGKKRPDDELSVKIDQLIQSLLDHAAYEEYCRITNLHSAQTAVPPPQRSEQGLATQTAPATPTIISRIKSRIKKFLFRNGLRSPR